MFEGLKRILNKKEIKSDLKKAFSVLVVEDNEVDRTFIQKTLERQGYKIFLAENGEVGLKMAKENRPDLILLDCEMPVMGGVETCQRLKEIEETHNIPIIFLTSVQTPENILNCFELDAENYLSKPISSKLLASHIASMLKQSTSHA